MTVCPKPVKKSKNKPQCHQCHWARCSQNLFQRDDMHVFIHVSTVNFELESFLGFLTLDDFNLSKFLSFFLKVSLLSQNLN